MFVSMYISTNVFFSKWNFLHKFGEKLSWVKIIIWRKKPQMFQNIFPDFFPVCFQVPGIMTALHTDPHTDHNYEKILIIVVNLLWSYQQWHSTHVVEEATVKIGHNVRTTNKWVGFNPNNILNNTGL